MPKLQPVSMLIGIYALSVLTGISVCLSMLYQIITKGPRKFFYRKEYTQRPKCMMDPIYGQHGYVTLKSGIKLHTVTAGDSNKPLMLFLHGFPENWYSWRYQIKEFSKDYRTLAVDMRGYGESDKPIGVSEYYIDNLTDDIKELVEAMGVEKCILVAHDWGGIVAQIFTLKHPTMVEKLVLCNIPHLRAFRKHLQTAWSQQKKSWYMFFFQLPWLPELMCWANDYRMLEEIFSVPAPITKRKPIQTAEELDAFKFAISRNGGLTSSINYYRASNRYAPPQLGTWIVNVPTLMIFGVGDSAIDAQTCELSRKYFVDFELNYIEESRHWVQQEAPEQVNQSIRNYLQKRD